MFETREVRGLLWVGSVDGVHRADARAGRLGCGCTDEPSTAKEPTIALACTYATFGLGCRALGETIRCSLDLPCPLSGGSGLNPSLDQPRERLGRRMGAAKREPHHHRVAVAATGNAQTRLLAASADESCERSCHAGIDLNAGSHGAARVATRDGGVDPSSKGDRGTSRSDETNPTNQSSSNAGCHRWIRDRGVPSG